MTRSRLYAAVAQVTGEALAVVNRIGFSEDNGYRQKPAGDPLKVVPCPCCGGTVVLAWSRFDKPLASAQCRRCGTTVEVRRSQVYSLWLDDIEPLRVRKVPAG
jgi:hypothetical protein